MLSVRLPCLNKNSNSKQSLKRKPSSKWNRASFLTTSSSLDEGTMVCWVSSLFGIPSLFKTDMPWSTVSNPHMLKCTIFLISSLSICSFFFFLIFKMLNGHTISKSVTSKPCGWSFDNTVSTLTVVLSMSLRSHSSLRFCFFSSGPFVQKSKYRATMHSLGSFFSSKGRLFELCFFSSFFCITLVAASSSKKLASGSDLRTGPSPYQRIEISTKSWWFFGGRQMQKLCYLVVGKGVWVDFRNEAWPRKINQRRHLVQVKFIIKFHGRLVARLMQVHTSKSF